MSLGRAGVLRGRRRWTEPLLEALARPPRDTAAWMEQHTRILKSDSHSRVGLIELGGVLCYLKFYRQKSIFQQLWFWLGRGRGVRAYDRAEQLAATGIPVPKPRACLLVPGGMLLLAEGIQGASDLKALWRAAPEDAQLGELMGEAGVLMANLHRADFFHGDCKWSNWLWNGSQFYLVDLEAVGGKRLSDRGQLRDLARFTLNGEDMGLKPGFYEMFLADYAKGMGLTRDEVVERQLPALRFLRTRHEKKYGARGHRLV